MSQVQLEERVARLERRVDELTGAAVQEKDWRRTVGMFRGDAVMKEVIDEALRQREDERRLARGGESEIDP